MTINHLFLENSIQVMYELPPQTIHNDNNSILMLIIIVIIAIVILILMVTDNHQQTLNTGNSYYNFTSSYIDV